MRIILKQLKQPVISVFTICTWIGQISAYWLFQGFTGTSQSMNRMVKLAKVLVLNLECFCLLPIAFGLLTLTGGNILLLSGWILHCVHRLASHYLLPSAEQCGFIGLHRGRWLLFGDTFEFMFYNQQFQWYLRSVRDRCSYGDLREKCQSCSSFFFFFSVNVSTALLEIQSRIIEISP